MGIGRVGLRVPEAMEATSRRPAMGVDEVDGPPAPCGACTRFAEITPRTDHALVFDHCTMNLSSTLTKVLSWSIDTCSLTLWA